MTGQLTLILTKECADKKTAVAFVETVQKLLTLTPETETGVTTMLSYQENYGSLKEFTAEKAGVDATVEEIKP